MERRTMRFPTITVVCIIASLLIPALPHQAAQAPAPLENSADAAAQPTDDASATTRSDFIGNWALVDNGTGPSPREAFGMCSNDKKNEFFIFGGMGVTEQKDLWKYNISKKEWVRLLDDVPIKKRNLFDMFFFNDNLYIFGGYCRSESKDLNDTWKYDINKNTWVEIKSIYSPSPRSGYSLVFDNIRFCYLFGGQNSSGFLNDFWVFDVSTENWTQISSDTEESSRAAAQMILFGKSLYIFGGMHGVYEINYNFLIYNISTNIWTNVSNSSETHPRWAHAMVFDNKKTLTS